MKTLLLTLEYPARASYYDDWRDSFLRAPQFDVTLRNIFEREAREDAQRTIAAYELIVVLHACTADSLLYAEPLAGALQARKGRLVAFVGNELNIPFTPLGDKIAWLKRVRPDIIATQLLEEAGAWLYAEVGAKVISLPHALNPEAFSGRTPQRERPIDIGARSFRYLAYLGDDERNRIYDYFAANPFDLALDFSTEQRFDRAGWAAFLDRCKATIATEAGSWYLERDDATVLAIRDHVMHSTSGRGFVIRADFAAAGTGAPAALPHQDAGAPAPAPRADPPRGDRRRGHGFRRDPCPLLRRPAAGAGLFEMHQLAPFRRGRHQDAADHVPRPLQRHPRGRPALPGAPA